MIISKITKWLALREKCPYSEFFWSVFSPNAGKYGPEKLRIWALFMQCSLTINHEVINKVGAQCNVTFGGWHEVRKKEYKLSQS